MLSVFHCNVFPMFYSTSKRERNKTVKVSYCKEGEVKITLYKYCYSGAKQSLMILLPKFFKFFLGKILRFNKAMNFVVFQFIACSVGWSSVNFFSLFFRFKNHKQWLQQATGTTCKQDEKTCESLGDKIFNKKGIISPSPKKRKRMHVSWAVCIQTAYWLNLFVWINKNPNNINNPNAQWQAVF